MLKNRYKLNNIKKNISINVELDDQQLPVRIVWEPNDDMANELELKSLFISGWDEVNKTTATFNIWTKDLRKDEMQQNFVQSVLTLASNFQKATGDTKMVEGLKNYFNNYSPE